ncbi:hypothetical protein [Nocardia blacklockiae]|uniref:hypothetical protein n=1 Tax=Nocardia blacklockiae TaxID=480036 RepID=UPI001E2E2B2F|nr:hypothetical protein [Nocardia blacklockiae]
MQLLNPKTETFAEFDPNTRGLLRAVVEFFETKGKQAVCADAHAGAWYDDWMGFLARSRILAYFATPAKHAQGDPDKRWDTAFISKFNELTGFYGAQYWYAWGVSTLGLAVIWQSDNAAAHRLAAEELDRGGLIGFGRTSSTARTTSAPSIWTSIRWVPATSCTRGARRSTPRWRP